jgi:AraC-like DNA-binding protein
VREKMRSFSCPFFEDSHNDGLNKNDRVSDAWPLVANCSGAVSINAPFTTYNTVGRSDYYLMYIMEGRLSVNIEGEECVAKTGDFVIFPPEYRYKYTFSDGGVISYYYVHFTGSEVEKTLHALGLSTKATVYASVPSDAVVDAFSEIFTAYTENDEYSEIAAGVAIKRVLVALARARTSDSARSPIRRSLAYIRASYTDDVRIPHLAAMDGFSVSRYNTVFREETGTSPTRLIGELRLGHACTLLSSTDLPIGDIGRMVGYPDNHFFSKIFKSYIGISPKEYRQRAVEVKNN